MKNVGEKIFGVDNVGAKDFSPLRNAKGQNRRSIRLKGYDYSQPGGYFVTACTHNLECLFGRIADEKWCPNDAGRVVAKCWNDIPKHFPHVKLVEFVVMPNHVHGVILIMDDVGESHFVGARHAVPLQNAVHQQFGKPISGSLSTIIRSFKSAVTKNINEMRQALGAKLWQRNYYEHIVRNEDELSRIREYIVNNPLKWELDRENPDIVGARSRSIGMPLQDEPWRI